MGKCIFILWNMRKYSKEFIVEGTKQLLRKHLGLEVDEQEIDPNISISENYFIIKEKYTNPKLCDLVDYL